MTPEIQQILTELLGCYVAAWVVGFAIGAKFRIFKQATEVIS